MTDLEHQVEAELKARVESVQERVSELQTLQNPNDHKRILCRVMQDQLDEIKREPGMIARLRMLVAVERIFRIVLELQAQALLAPSRLLPLAQPAARDGYQYAMLAARVLGVRPRAERWPEPAVLLEPMATPVTLVRGSSAAALGLTGQQLEQLPFPVVLLPWYPITALGSLSVVQHEIGHNLDHDLGISDALQGVLEEQLTALDLKPEVIETWVGWRQEMVADVFGVMLAGAAFALELCSWAHGFGTGASFASPTHPFPVVRVALARQLLTRLGIDIDSGTTLLTGLTQSAPAEDGVMPFLERAPLVADILLDAPLSCLHGASLRDLAPDVAREHALLVELAKAMAEELRSDSAGHSAADTKQLPYRLLPSLARFAVLLNADATRVHQRIEAAGSGRTSPDAEPIRAEIFYRHTLRSITVPILDEERDGLKLPPPGLFRSARRIAFVGSTQDGLPGLFDDYRKAGGVKKQQIDVFFLSAPALVRMSNAQQSPEQLATLQQQGRNGLTRELLDAIAESWRIFEYDDPFYFASYWDADSQGGRIHVSAHGWEQNIKVAPATDHLWSSGAARPGRTYRFYLDALNGLHRRARLLASR